MRLSSPLASLRPSRVLAVVVICLGCIMASPSVIVAAPVKAKLTLKTGVTWSVELLQRVSQGEIRLKVLDQNQEITVGLDQVSKVQFDLAFERNHVEQLYGDADLKAVADLLWKNLRPIFPYLDLPCNGPEYLPMMMNALFWTGAYAKINEVSYPILRIKDKSLQQLSSLYKLLAIIEQDRLLVAADEVKKIQNENPDLAQSPMVLYASARLKAGQKDWIAAQQIAARIIVFHPKDFDWMPPALVLSARSYVETGKPDIAEQIVQEIKLAYPKKQWISMADALQKPIEEKRAAIEKTEAAKAKAEEPAGADSEKRQNTEIKNGVTPTPN